MDIIQEKVGKLIAYEIKSFETYHPDFLKGLKYFKNLVAETEFKLLLGGNLHQESDGVKIINLQNIESNFYNDYINVFANKKVQLGKKDVHGFFNEYQDKLKDDNWMLIKLRV